MYFCKGDHVYTNIQNKDDSDFERFGGEQGEVFVISLVMTAILVFGIVAAGPPLSLVALLRILALAGVIQVIVDSLYSAH